MVRRVPAAIGLIVMVLAACESPSPIASWVERMETLREEASAHLSKGEHELQVAALGRATALAPPTDGPRIRAIRQDAWFALGRAQFDIGRFGASIRAADEGLRLSDASTVFTANLHALRATALEALARPAEAIADYERALSIHQALFDEALAEHERSTR